MKWFMTQSGSGVVLWSRIRGFGFIGQIARIDRGGVCRRRRMCVQCAKCNSSVA